MTSKNSIEYRFHHETNASFKTLELNSSHLSTADAKIHVARASGLEREFARTIDLKVFLVGVDDTLNELVSDDAIILANSKIVVQRVPWNNRPAIEHIVNELAELEEIVPTKRLLPKEFLCAVCRNILTEPVVVRCENKCNGKSCCKMCVAAPDLSDIENRNCLFCKGKILYIVPNKALASILMYLSVDEFEIPTTASCQTKIEIPEGTHVKSYECIKPEYSYNDEFTASSVKLEHELLNTLADIVALFPKLLERDFILLKKAQEFMKNNSTLVAPKEFLFSKHYRT